MARLLTGGSLEASAAVQDSCRLQVQREGPMASTLPVPDEVSRCRGRTPAPGSLTAEVFMRAGWGGRHGWVDAAGGGFSARVQ